MRKEIDKIKILEKLIEESNNIVFFGGAGVSTESGIPDFRSEDGLYNQKYKYPPETILSHTFFMSYTEEFYKFYKEKMNVLMYEPNITHYYLAKLEQCGKLKAVITQNIDGLHQKAGSRVIYELHGNIFRNFCMKCRKQYDADIVFNSDSIPKCECGGVIKPDVVLYEETLNEDVVNNAIEKILNCELLIIGGTSLTVYPASSLINYYKGKNLVLINKDVTKFDNKANLVINDSLGNVFRKLDKNNYKTNN